MRRAELAVDLQRPFAWAARDGARVRTGSLDLPGGPQDSAAVLAALTENIKPRLRTPLAVALPLPQCTLRRLAKPTSAKPQHLRDFARLSVGPRAQGAADSVTDYTETPTALVAAGCPAAASAAIAAAARKAGFTLAGIEPAPLALLRALAGSDPGVVLALHLYETDVLLVCGGADEFFLARHISWRAAGQQPLLDVTGALDALALEIEQTVASHERETSVPIDRIAVSGPPGTVRAVIDGLAAALMVPIVPGGPHAHWGLPDTDPAALVAFGALLDPPAVRRAPPARAPRTLSAWLRGRKQVPA